MLKYLSIILIVLIVSSISVASAETNVAREIEQKYLSAGSSTNINVTVKSDINQALSLMEILPPGWTITRISDDASSYKNSTNEWIWFKVVRNVTKTVTYRLEVPADTAIGKYNISGKLQNSSGIIGNVIGEDSITLVGTGDLNNNGVSADAGDLVLMKRASTGEIQADSRYDLNDNGKNADAGDLVLMKRASIGEIALS